MQIESVWEPNKEEEIEYVFGKQQDPTAHKEIQHILYEVGSHYVGGKLKKVQLPVHFDFISLRSNFFFILNTFYNRISSSIERILLI